MSLFAAESSPPPEVYKTTPAAPRWWPWVWALLACLLVGASGVVRAWQDHRFDAVRTVKVVPEFPLSSLPKQVGQWTERGGESRLDPRVARIAGSEDALVRSYVDNLTGVTLEVLILFGPAEQVSHHIPEYCYPAIGYLPSDPPVPQSVVMLGNDFKPLPLPPAGFRTMAYERRGKSLERLEIHYAFRQNGRWTPDVDGNWKTLSLSPGLYKVQVQRRIAEQERRILDADNPSVQFLSLFLPEIERRIALAARARAAAPLTPTPKPAGAPRG